MKQIVEQSKSLGGFSGNLNSLADAKAVMSKLEMSPSQASQMPQGTWNSKPVQTSRVSS
jgi:hypothetical protein